MTTTTRSLQQAFDDDDTGAYDPETTGALPAGPRSAQLVPSCLRFARAVLAAAAAADDDDDCAAAQLCLWTGFGLQPAHRLPPPSPAAAAIILTGGDEEAEARALQLCKEAEISCVLRDSQEQLVPEFLSSTPKSFMTWAAAKKA